MPRVTKNQVSAKLSIQHLMIGTAIVGIFLSLSRLGNSGLQIFPILCLLYVGKRITVNFTHRHDFRIVSHTLLCIASLPYLYLFATDSPSPSIHPNANWIGLPIITYTIPTVSLLIDIWIRDYYDELLPYILRSVFEILIIAPIWAVVWVFAEIEWLKWIIL